MADVRYADPDKEKSRRELFGAAAQVLLEAKVSPQDAKALILVDGRQPHSQDVQTLEALGFRRQNINAVARNWDCAVAGTYYGGVNVVQSELAHHLRTTPGEYQLAYFDFCKPLGNELNEHHFTVFSHLFEHQRLASTSVLITNFNLLGYWDDPMYRDFLRAYAARDYYREGGFGMMSMRAWSSGLNYLGDLFAPDQRPTSGDLNLEQKILTVMCYMDNILRDIAEVFVPARCYANAANKAWLKIIDEPVASNVSVDRLPPELRTKKSCLMGRLSQTLGLVECCPERIRNQMLSVTGDYDVLLAFACFTDLMYATMVLEGIYDVRCQGGYPYPPEQPRMLPIVWKVSRRDEINSAVLWGHEARR